MTTSRPHDERGLAAIWMALVFLFLIGVTALAIDTSGFFNRARVDQTTADLACLAGVQELPLRPDDALTIAAENVKANFPEMAGATSTPIPRGVELIAGGNVVTINAPAEFNRFRMQISVTSSESRGFSKIWSSSDVLITQLARCTAVADTGPTMLPVGVVTGSFDEDLSDCGNNADGGDCGVLQPGAGSWAEAFEKGVIGEFERHWGNWSSPDPETGQVGIPCPPTPGGYTDLCNAVLPEMGPMINEFANGYALRMARADSEWAEFQGIELKKLDEVFGPSEPSWWETGVYGSYASNKQDQYYWNGDIIGCGSSRMAMMPIMEKNPNWAPGTMGETWDTSDYLKIVGFYSIYFRDSDSGVEANVIWFGADATCDGEKLDFYGNVGGSEHVKLIGA
jgi:Flp pilus assembly protein TadG